MLLLESCVSVSCLRVVRDMEYRSSELCFLVCTCQNVGVIIFDTLLIIGIDTTFVFSLLRYFVVSIDFFLISICMEIHLKTMNDQVLTPANTSTTCENTNEKPSPTTTGSPSTNNGNYTTDRSGDSHTFLKLQDALNDELVSKTTNRNRPYPSQFELSVNDSQRGFRFEQVYEKGPLLGEGGFAFVYRCKHKQNQYWYAVKEVDVDVYEGSDLKTEIAVMKTLFDSPYMVRLHDVFLEPHFTYLVMEEVKGGDLLDALERKQTYSVREARKVSRTLLEAVAWCHKKRIAHRDIKPENILLMHKGDDTSIKLCDFGCAKFFQPDTAANSFHTMVGSPQYVAPEIYLADLHVGYGPQCDLWSTGVVIYVLLGGYCPFDADNPFDLSKYICEGYFKFHSKYWNHVPDAPRELIKHLLVVDPLQRWNSKQALDCTWLRRPQLKRFGSDPRINSVGRTSKKSSLETTLSEAVIDGSACTVIHSPAPTKDPPGVPPVMSSPAATPARLVKHCNETVRPEEPDETIQEAKLEKEDFMEKILMPTDVEKSVDKDDTGAGSTEIQLTREQAAETAFTAVRDAVDQLKRESTSSTATEVTVNSTDDEAGAVAPGVPSGSTKLPTGCDVGQSVVENKLLPPPPEYEINERPESPTKFLRKSAQEDQPGSPSSPRPPLKQPWHISLMDIGVSDHSITELMHESSHSNTENSNDSSESDDFASEVPMFTWKRSTGPSPSPWEGKSGVADSTTLKVMRKQHKSNRRESGKKKKDRLSRYANSESVLKIPKDLITVDEGTAEEESGGGLDGKSAHSLARRYSLTDLEDHDLPETLEPLPGIPMMWLESFPRVIRREIQASTRPRRPSVLAHM